MNRRDIGQNTTRLTPEAIFDSISDAVIAIDAEKHILWFNQAAEKMSGLSRTEAVGRPCSAVLRSSMCGDGCALQRSLKAGKPMIDAPAFVNSGGKRIAISVSMALIRDAGGRVIGSVETIRELSAVEPRNQQESGEEFEVPPLTSRSPLMQKVLDQLAAIASSRSTVLILGETGTGKELVACTIHMLGPRRHGPFVAVNCGAFTETLLASELFGHKRGAFTGADKDRAGCFAQAKGGTLFLDDIEAMSAAMQVHLLRVLQEHVYQPVGAARSETTDARVILATNEDLLGMVREGAFRQDLYYRVNVASLELPPLRHRTEDVPLLVQQIVERFNQLQGKSIQGIRPEALEMLKAYDWPGNVRELQNVIEQAFIRCREAFIGIEHLQQPVAAQGSSRRSTSDQYQESRAIRAALKRNLFNRLATAKELGIDRTTLFRRMKRFKITCRKKNGRRKRA